MVIKSGRTEVRAEAAASHTGSIVGSDEAYQAGFHQAGALRAMDIQEVFDFGRVLSGEPLLEHANVAVVTNVGGPGVLTTDAIGESRLTVAEFDDDLRTQLADILPEGADVTNPLDIVGDAGIDRFKRRWLVATATVAPTRRVRTVVTLASSIIGHIFCMVRWFDFIATGTHFGDLSLSLALFFALRLLFSVIFRIYHPFS